MSKTLTHLATLFALLALVSPILTAHSTEQPLATQVYITPTAISQDVGTQFTLTAGITDVVNLTGFGVQLAWNSTILDYVSHTSTPENVLNATGTTIIPIKDEADAAAGTYDLAIATFPPTAFTGSGIIFTLTLEVNAIGFSDLQFSVHDLADPDATPIANVAVNGTFDNRPAQYELAITVAGSGTTDPAVGSYMYDEDTIVPVTAYPDSGWTFDHWLLDTVDVGATNPYNVTMNSNHTLEAVFVELPPTLFSCDDTGTEKNEFNTTDLVYVTGDGFDPEEALTIYVVPNGDPFNATASIFNTAALANGSGALSPVQLGTFDIGDYDVWIDRNGNGVLDPATEPVDTFDTESGFIVIPEFAAGITLTMALCLAALSILAIRKRKTN